MSVMVHAEGLVKSFGHTRALAGLDLAVTAGTTMRLLGRNGAGKTTAVRVLTTLLRPDAGTALVAGHDVVADGAAVRRSIGLAGQHTSVDECLTGRANLVMLGRLSRLGRRQARDRAADVLIALGLAEAAGRPVRGYSGGMRRRLDLAASLLTRPDVLFLDEPTTGLDPASRLALWEIITGLVAGGTTLLLTTQYLEEADRLADRVLRHRRRPGHRRGDPGRAEGDGRDILAAGDRRRHHAAVPGGHGTRQPRGRPGQAAGRARTRTAGDPRPGLVADAVLAMAAAGTRAEDIAVRTPSLDDVFLALTGSRT